MGPQVTRRWHILPLLAALALLYLAYPARKYQYDAVIYSSAALRGDPWIALDPGHLAYGPLEVAAAAIGRKAHPPLSPILLLQYLSMVAALAGLYAFHRTLTDLGVGPGRAAVFAGILGCTYGYWHYALQAESHVVSTAFLLFFLWRFVALLGAPTRRAAVSAGALLGLATLMHQQHVLIVLPALVALPFAEHRGRRLAAVAGSFLATYVAVAVLPYLVDAVGLLGLRTIGDIRLWIVGLGTWGRWGHWTRMTPFWAGVGLARCLVGSHFVLGLAPMRAFALARGAWCVDKFPIAAAVPPILCKALFLLEALLLAFGAGAIARRAGHLGRLASRQAGVVVFLLAWLVVRAVLPAWWQPRLVEFWIDFFPPLLVLLALPLGQRTERSGHEFRLAGAFCVTLAAVNFLGSIRPEALPAIDRETHVAIALEAGVRPGDTVLADIPFQGTTSQYVETFMKVDLLARTAGDDERTQEARLSLIDSVLAAADSTGRTVYLVATPLGRDEARRAAYRDLVASLATRYELSKPLPIRAEIELRKIGWRRGARR